MPDDVLFSELYKDLPKFNPLIAKGFACSQIRHAAQYVDQIIRCVSRDFPPGLTYVNCTRCDPEEEYKMAIMPRSGKSTFQFAQSDLYLMRFNFEFKGPNMAVPEPLRPCYLYLPFLREAGQLVIQGSKFVVNAVLIDPALSVGHDSVYVPLNRHKLIFKRHIHNFTIKQTQTGSWENVVPERELAYVFWGALFNNDAAKGNTTGRYTNLVHYLFAKFGFLKACKEYFSLTPIIQDLEESVAAYSPDEYMIFESVGNKPPGYKGFSYNKPGVRLILPKSQYTLSTKAIIASFFHTVDLFPHTAVASEMEGDIYWKLLLGRLLHGETDPDLILLKKINTHIDSLDGYIDSMVREWFKDDGIYVDNFWEFLRYAILKFPEKMASSSQNISTMYGKKLTVLRYVLADIINAINRMLFSLKSASGKGLTKDNVQTCLQEAFKPKLIVRINQNGSEVTSIASAGDCYIHKLTSNLVMQTASGSGKFTSARGGFDVSQALDSSIAEVGQLTNLPKRDPTGRGKINPFANVDNTGRVYRNPEFVELLDKIQKEIGH